MARHALLLIPLLPLGLAGDRVLRPDPEPKTREERVEPCSSRRAAARIHDRAVVIDAASGWWLAGLPPGASGRSGAVVPGLLSPGGSG
jgi:hypothetical protein